MESLSNRLLHIDSLKQQEDCFRKILEDEINRFIADMRNNNTKRKTMCDARLLHSWMEANLGDKRNAEFISPAELDSVLARFFLSIRKPDWTEHEPESIKSNKYKQVFEGEKVLI